MRQTDRVAFKYFTLITTMDLYVIKTLTKTEFFYWNKPRLDKKK